jgi:hypothetical protein
MQWHLIDCEQEKRNKSELFNVTQQIGSVSYFFMNIHMFFCQVAYVSLLTENWDMVMGTKYMIYFYFIFHIRQNIYIQEYGE